MLRIKNLLLFFFLISISIVLIYFPYITYTCVDCTKDSVSILEIYAETSDMESVAATVLLSAVWLPLIFCIQALWMKTPLSMSAKIVLWTEVAFAVIAWFASALIMSLHRSPHDRTVVFAGILIYEAFFALDMIIFLIGFSGFGVTKKMFTRAGY